jgi:hypothetical protein
MTCILQVLVKVMKVFGHLIAHIEAFNELILRNFEQSQFFDILAQLLKYFILIPFLMLFYLIDLYTTSCQKKELKNIMFC